MGGEDAHNHYASRYVFAGHDLVLVREDEGGERPEFQIYFYIAINLEHNISFIGICCLGDCLFTLFISSNGTRLSSGR